MLQHPAVRKKAKCSRVYAENSRLSANRENGFEKSDALELPFRLRVSIACCLTGRHNVLGSKCASKANRTGANDLLTTSRATVASDDGNKWLNPQGSHFMMVAPLLTLPSGIKIVHHHYIDSRPNRHKGELIHKLLGFKAGSREGPASKAQGPRR